MITIAVSNQKGGVGKTATAHALGELLSGEGLRVLMVDTDPQASLTMSAGVMDAGGRSLAEVLGGASPGSLAMSAIIQELGEGLHLAPADIALAGMELGLNSRLGRESVLRKALNQVATRFDLCLIDCPPSLGLLTIGALVAADAVLIPTQPEIVALRGLELFLETVYQVKKELSPDLEIMGVLVTFYDGRLNHHKAAVETMQRAGLPVLPVTIGRSVRVAEAAGSGQSVATFEARNPRAGEYNQLAREVKRWLNNRAG